MLQYIKKNLILTRKRWISKESKVLGSEGLAIGIEEDDNICAADAIGHILYSVEEQIVNTTVSEESLPPQRAPQLSSGMLLFRP